MPARRVLVVEDDPAIRRGVVDALRFQGYLPLEATTFKEALASATRDSFDLLLLDLVLPGGDGLDVLAEARKARPTLPVIVLTARGQEEDRVRGLRLGADDYVVKPFSVKELLARVEAVLRRSAERPLDVEEIRFEGGVADLRKCELRFEDGAAELLSEREIDLLRYLSLNRERVVSRDELLQRVWRLPASLARTRTVDMHVARLRDKLRDSADEPRILLTVRGKGYRFAGGDPG
ncbi:response regulator transcription factor [Hyalangium versicolor]|uniref:response regulator transcription factor n=1 Tax=Hyalangium versicolor TaxID=2861190 RepID=UPI001CC94789|nr:response regulator transcription factor [Hyalangium versicolor]